MRDKHGEVYPDEPTDSMQYQGMGDEYVAIKVKQLGRSTPWFSRVNANGKAAIILPMQYVTVPGRIMVRDENGLHEFDATATDKWRPMHPAERISARRMLTTYIGLGIEVPGDNPTYRSIRNRGFNGDSVSQDPSSMV